MTLVYASITLTMLFWALSYIWIKIIFQFYRPITTIYLRTILAGTILWVIGKLLKKLQPIAKKDRKDIIILTLIHPLLYFLLETYSLVYVSPTVASVIISMIPLLIPIAAYFFLNEKVTKLNIAGMIVSFAGVVILVTRGDFSIAASPFGILLLFGAVLTGITFTIQLKKVAERYNAYTVVTYQNLLGIIWFTPLFLLVDLDHFLGVQISSKGIMALIMLAVFASAAAFILFTYALNILGASKTSIFTNCIPVFTAALSWLYLDEQITLRMFVGIIIVVSGLFVSQIRKKKKMASGGQNPF